MPTQTRSPRRMFAYICISALLWIADANAAEQYIIIKAQPETTLLTPGKKFSVGDLIPIPKNTTVTLLGEDGSVTKVTGPVAINVTPDTIENKTSDDGTAKEAAGTLSRISDFLLKRLSNESTFGGTRTTQTTLSDPWVIPIDGNTLGCFRDGVVGLSRSDARHHATIHVTFSDHSDNFRFFWKSSEYVAYLPPGFSGGRAVESLNVEGISEAIKLFELPKSINSSDGLRVLSWMIEIGCSTQANSIVDQLAAKAEDLK